MLLSSLLKIVINEKFLSFLYLMCHRIPGCVTKALHLSAELRFWWKCYSFLHLGPTKFERKIATVSCFFGYKVAIEQHFKSRLFRKTKTKCQETENSLISVEPFVSLCVLSCRFFNGKPIRFDVCKHCT